MAPTRVKLWAKVKHILSLISPSSHTILENTGLDTTLVGKHEEIAVVCELAEGLALLL